MSGPTVFAEVIDYAAAQARSKQEFNAAVGEQSYTILLILTDGAVTDIEETKSAIRNASTAPLSIVIVGIGSADFSTMRFLDDFQKQEGGQTRDIVKFVEFSRHTDDRAALTRETLDEIPDQLVDYFYENKIMPLPPSTGSKIDIQADEYDSEGDMRLSLTFSETGEIRLSNPAQATWDSHSYGTSAKFLPPATAPVEPSSRPMYSTNNHVSPPAYAPTAETVVAYATPVAVPLATVRVQAPANSYPGMQLQVQNPLTGQFKIITVPQGVAPGMAFTLQI